MTDDTALPHDALIFRDRIHPDSIRVEGFDADGGCEVAVFSGPRAIERALMFGQACYGAALLRDPDGLRAKAADPKVGGS